MLFKPSYFLVCDLFWSDFLLCQKIGNIWSSNIKSRIRPLALHPMLALHPPPVEERCPWISLFFLDFDRQCGCSGPGGIWGVHKLWGGLPGVPPPSKDGESPSNPNVPCSMFHKLSYECTPIGN